MKRTAVLVCAAAWLAAPAVWAQESYFGLQFLGASEETGDVRSRGMGVLGIGLDDPHTAITLNPAAHAALERMTISIMGLAGGRSATDGAISDGRGWARFPHQRVALPVFGQAVLSVGFVGWRNFEGDFALAEGSIDGFTYSQDFRRDGTLYTIPLGVARRFGKYFQAGLALDFILGTVDEAWTSSGDSLVSLRTRRRDTFSGRGLTLGVLVHPMSNLTLGASVAPEFEVDRNAHFTIEDGRSAGGAALRDSSALSDVTLPFVVRAGASLAAGKRWTVASDFLYRDWQAYNGRLYGLSGADPVGSEIRFGGGVEFQPRRSAWWGRPAYRAGVSRTTWPQRIGGEDLHELGVHAGFGLGLRDGKGRVDVGFEYARIGNLDDNGARENVWRVLVGFSGQEVWRRKSPRN
jgi:hypothetical protein